MKNKCYIDSDYIGEHHKGSIFTIELIHNNEIDIYVKQEKGGLYENM